MNGKVSILRTKKFRGHSIGFLFSLLSSALILSWLGLFKFTQAEAEAIHPLIKHHPLASWLYDVFSIPTVSYAVGIIEIAIALLLLFSLWKPSLSHYAALGMMVVFATTLSFLFTTPGVWHVTGHVLITDFFIVKDLMFLGFGIMLLEFSHSIQKDNRNE